ncbi:MAG: NVEALA domain-containing protein [Dysgonamonadaceae bacterium]|jgi:hypothetical protein|nr:NVEALA domain-containing protein [Dysgonamonadaceae bacterium]
MKKKILYGLAVALIAVVATVNVQIAANNKGEASDLMLENVEALSQESSGSLPSADKWSSLSYMCFDKNGYINGSGVNCFHPGYSSSCTSKKCGK